MDSTRTPPPGHHGHHVMMVMMMIWGFGASGRHWSSAPIMAMIASQNQTSLLSDRRRRPSPTILAYRLSFHLPSPTFHCPPPAAAANPQSAAPAPQAEAVRRTARIAKDRRTD